jgi:beta-glucanase (GH16 family)
MNTDRIAHGVSLSRVNVAASALRAGVCALSAICGSAGIAHAQPGQIPGWRLVWNEEFNGTALNNARWFSENIAWPYNAEQQYYLPQQATVGNGRLEIKAERRTVGGRNFVSARINTSPSFAQQYGRFEARMRVPAGQGFWPAFWLLPATQQWPPEIDIMETIGSHPNRVYFTHHWGTVSNVMSNGTTYTGVDYTAGYHRYAVEWSPTRVDWYLDGALRFTTTGNFPHEPMYIILNMAVGGTLPGNVNATTPFPRSTLVDWVRVYWRDTPLANPSFENSEPNGALSGWQVFGNASASSAWASDGVRSLRLSGITGNGPYYSGAFQDLPAAPGQNWTATARVRHASASRLTAGNFADLKIEWYDRTGAALGTSGTTAINTASAVDTTINVSVNGVAPANTARARIAVVFVQPTNGAGAVQVDQVTGTFASPPTTPVCPGDINGDGGVSVQDIFNYLNLWFAGDAFADVNERDGVTVQDIFDFLEQWFGGCA